jgi:hypothetical protein
MWQNVVRDVFNKLTGRLKLLPTPGAARHNHALGPRFVRAEVSRAASATSCVSSGEETEKLSVRYFLFQRPTSVAGVNWLARDKTRILQVSEGIR